MANSCKQLHRAFIKRGMTDRDAFYALIDHFNEQHWHDRNAYHKRIKELEAKVAALEAKCGQS